MERNEINDNNKAETEYNKALIIREKLYGKIH